MSQCNERGCSRQNCDACAHCNKVLCDDHLYFYGPKTGLSGTFMVGSPVGQKPSRQDIAEAERLHDQHEAEAIANWRIRMIDHGYNPNEWGTTRAFRTDDQKWEDVGWGFCDACHRKITLADSEEMNQAKRTKLSQGTSDMIQADGRSGGCFIATVVFENEAASEVVILKSFRDNYLLTTYLGRWMIGKYYHYGPMMARRVKHRYFTKKILRFILLQLVWGLTKLLCTDPLADAMRENKT